MLSVIIATLNCERALVPTLATLVPGAAAGTVRDVIIADGGSKDATLEVADIAGCEIMASQCSTGGPVATSDRQGARLLGHVSAAWRSSSTRVGSTKWQGSCSGPNCAARSTPRPRCSDAPPRTASGRPLLIEARVTAAAGAGRKTCAGTGSYHSKNPLRPNRAPSRRDRSGNRSYRAPWPAEDRASSQRCIRRRMIID